MPLTKGQQRTLPPGGYGTYFTAAACAHVPGRMAAHHPVASLHLAGLDGMEKDSAEFHPLPRQPLFLRS